VASLSSVDIDIELPEGLSEVTASEVLRTFAPG
jgi:hypothetical protein